MTLHAVLLCALDRLVSPEITYFPSSSATAKKVDDFEINLFSLILNVNNAKVYIPLRSSVVILERFNDTLLLDTGEMLKLRSMCTVRFDNEGMVI